MRRSLCVITVVLLMLVCVSVQASMLPIGGSHFRLAADNTGEVFLMYHQGKNLRVFDIKAGTDYGVPEGNLYGSHLHSGIAVSGDRVVVSWTQTNWEIYSRELNSATGVWGPREKVFTDDRTDPAHPSWSDTNRSSMAINSSGDTMIVGQSDYIIKAKIKKLGQGWGPQMTAVPYSSSEPTHPQLVAYGDDFYLVCTITAQGGGLAGKSVGVFKYNGSWTKVHHFDIAGSPNSPGMAVDTTGKVYATWFDWLDKGTLRGMFPDFDFSGVEFGNFYLVGSGEGADNDWRQDALHTAPDVGTQDHPPHNGIAVDSVGNVVACNYNWNKQSTSSFIQIRRAGGEWGDRINKGNDGHISVVYSPADKKFFIVYLAGGVMLDTLSFEVEEPTPTPTEPPSGNIHKYDIYEVELQTDPGWANPFTQVTVYGKFRSGNFEKTVKGFYYGNNTFIIRFRPDYEGDWSFETWSTPDVIKLKKSGAFTCIAARENNHGPLNREGRFIKHADGSDYFHIGATAFGLLWRGPYLAYLQTIINAGVNEFRIGLNITWGRGENSHGFSGCGDDGYVNGCWLDSFMWGFSPYPANTDKDWSQMNLDRFRKLDESMKLLLEQGAFAELVLFDSSMKYALGPKETAGAGNLYTVNDPRQEFYLDYISRRYGAFPNFFWEIGNEIRHNQYSGNHNAKMEEWRKAKDWVRWVGQTMKEKSEHLVAYDFMWSDTWWGYGPTSMGMTNGIDPNAWHESLLREDWLDLINIHTDRQPGVWWWKTADQILYLIQTYNKPASADEPHRKGYDPNNPNVSDEEIRRAMWLTAMTGSGYYTIHGVSNGDICRGCVELSDLAGAAVQFHRFFALLGAYNFTPDWSLIEGQGSYLRAMHNNGTYVYYGIAPDGDFTFKTFKHDKYELMVMNPVSGVVETTIVEGQNIEASTTNMPEFVVSLKTLHAPTPTPTATPTVVPPTPTPTRKPGGGIGCATLAGADDGKSSNTDDFVVSLLLGMGIVMSLMVTAGALGRRKRIRINKHIQED